MKINIDTKVKVTLTTTGAWVLNNVYSTHEYYPGYVWETTLFKMFSAFGNGMKRDYTHMTQYIVNNEIEIL